MNYYPHHIGDFVRDTSRLNDSQCMAYLRLIWLYYETEQPLTNDVKRLAFQIGSDEKTVELLLHCFFYANAERWHHKRIDSEINAYKLRSSKASESAKTRWKNAKSMRTHSEGNANSDANQEPITNNQDIKDLNTIVASETGSERFPECPHSEILALFAKHLPSLVQPRTWEGTRETNLKARWRFVLTSKTSDGQRRATDKESALQWFADFFDYVSQSDFLTGRSTTWACDLPWLIKAENFSKVLDGNYHSKVAA